MHDIENMYDFSALRPLKDVSQFEKAVLNLIKTNFADHEKFKVFEERKLYNPMYSEYIWKQNKGLIPYVCEVYFDGDYVCDVSSNETPPDVVEKIQNGLVKLLARNG